MDLPNDNDLRSIDQRFLGPKGMTLYWEARYVAYPVWAAVMAVLFIVEHKIGIGIGPTSAICTLIVAVAVTTEIMRRVDAERPVRAVFQTFWHEIGSPRSTKPIAVQLHVRAIKRSVTA